jgi:hypothetical protein
MTFLTLTMASMPGLVEPTMLVPNSSDQMIPLDVALGNLGASFEEFNSFCQQLGCDPVHVLNDTPFVHRNTLSLLVNLKTNRCLWD